MDTPFLSPEQKGPLDDNLREVIALADEVLELPLWKRIGTGELEDASSLYPLTRLYGEEENVVEMLRPDVSWRDISALRNHLEDRNRSFEDSFEPSALARLLQKRRDKKRVARDKADNFTRPTVTIIEPFQLQSQRQRLKTYPECYGYIVSKTSIGGRFAVDDHEFELSLDEPVIAVDRVRWDSGDFNQSVFSKGQEHFVLVPSLGQLYYSEAYGDIDPTSVEPLAEGEVGSGLAAMKDILKEMRDAPNPRHW